VVSCPYGHDDMEIRLSRLTERRYDAVMNVLAQQQMVNEGTDRQLAKIHDARRPDAGRVEKNRALHADGTLSRKLRTKNDLGQPSMSDCL
jgi:hypothetical protein